MTRPALWTVGLLALAVLLPGASGAGERPAVPDLSGTWKLNDEVTWRMLQGMREREHGPGPGRGGPMGRPGGGGPRGGGGEGQPPGGGPGRPGGHGGFRGAQLPSLEALDELTISQHDGTVTITDAGGRARVLRTDGKKTRDTGPQGPETVRAKWKDGALVVKIKPEQGSKRTESWVITNDRKRLFLTLEIADGPPMPIRRAYDLVPAG